MKETGDNLCNVGEGRCLSTQKHCLKNAMLYIYTSMYKCQKQCWVEKGSGVIIYAKLKNNIPKMGIILRINIKYNVCRGKHQFQHCVVWRERERGEWHPGGVHKEILIVSVMYCYF